MTFNRLIILLLCISTGIVFLIIKVSLLTQEPPIWPDEAIYADIANNINNQNRLGTDLWTGTIPGIENHVYFYPPVFFYLLAFWFKFFGFSIENQRMLSVFVSILFIIVFYFFILQLNKNKRIKPLYIAILSFLIVDFIFIRASHVSRPEILVIFFGLLSLFFYYRSLSVVNNKKINISTILSALFASFSFLTHTLGILYFLSIITHFFIKHGISTFKFRKFYIFILFFVSPILVWFISIFPYFDLFLEQIFLAAARKRLEQNWWVTFNNMASDNMFIQICYMLITVMTIIYALKNKKNKHVLLSIVLLFSWFFTINGRMFWYWIFPVPFIYLSSIGLLQDTLRSKMRFIILISLAIIVFINLNEVFLNMQLTAGDNYSYKEFSNKILALIPDNKIVFLSSIPDAYYVFKMNGRANILYEFPVLPTDKQNYVNLLDQSDYIIYNGSFESVIFDNILKKYIDTNQSEVLFIKNIMQYQAQIIKLKPKNERVFKIN